jgi:hypothetical protein
MPSSRHPPESGGEDKAASHNDHPVWVCGDCLYFHEHDKNTGECHRHPPSFTGDGAPTELHRWRFPLVLKGSWCGEFRKKV